MDKNQIRKIIAVRKELDSIFNLLPGINFGIAGGKITRLLYKYFHNPSYIPYDSDYDLFFTNNNDLVRAKKILSSYSHFVENKKIVDHFKLKDGPKIDVISMVQPSFFKHLHNFDLSICCVMFLRDKFLNYNNAIQDILDKRIQLNYISCYPQSTTNRLIKFAKLGF